jgi:AcrR family transcriptional regulator
MRAGHIGTRAKSDPARVRLLRAALGCIALKGYADTSVEDICLAAGCSKGAFYFHFPSREGLLLALAKENLLVSPEAGEQPEEGITHRVLLETWVEAVRYGPLRRVLVRRFRRWLLGSSGSDGEPATALASALRTGLVIQRVVRPGTMKRASGPTLVRLGVEAPAA